LDTEQAKVVDREHRTGTVVGSAHVQHLVMPPMARYGQWPFARSAARRVVPN
jgi:hypothetical protein